MFFLGIMSGNFVDRRNKKYLFIITNIVFALTSLFFGLTTSSTDIYSILLITGIVDTLYYPILVSLMPLLIAFLGLLLKPKVIEAKKDMRKKSSTYHTDIKEGWNFIKKQTPEEMLGRVYGFINTVVEPLSVISILAGGILANYIEAKYIFLICAITEILTGTYFIRNCTSAHNFKIKH